MYKGTGSVKLTIGNLRFCSVEKEPNLLIDQYGRVFERGPKGKLGFDHSGLKLKTVGYTNH